MTRPISTGTNHLVIEKAINLDNVKDGVSYINARLLKNGKTISQITLKDSFMVGAEAKSIKDKVSISSDAKLAIQHAVDMLKERDPNFSGPMNITVKNHVSLVADLGDTRTRDYVSYHNDTDKSLLQSAAHKDKKSVLSHIDKKEILAGIKEVAKRKLSGSFDQNVETTVPKTQEFHIKDVNKPLDESNFGEVKQLEVMYRTHKKPITLPEARKPLPNQSLEMPQTPRGSEFFSPGRKGLERSTSLPVNSTIDQDFVKPVLQRSQSSPAALSSSAPAALSSSAPVTTEVEAKVHRQSDNRKLMISLIIEACVAASVLGAGLSQGGKIEDSADADYGNADIASADAAELQANEQTIIDSAGSAAFDAVTNELTAEAFTDPANQVMETNPQTGEMEPSGRLNDTVTEEIATEAKSAQQKAEATAQQMVETKVTQMQTYADEQRVQGDALNKEAKVVSGSTGTAGIALAMAAIWSGTKLTINRRHNHQAENNLMGQPGVFEARHKGNGIPQAVETKA